MNQLWSCFLTLTVRGHTILYNKHPPFMKITLSFCITGKNSQVCSILWEAKFCIQTTFQNMIKWQNFMFIPVRRIMLWLFHALEHFSTSFRKLFHYLDVTEMQIFVNTWESLNFSRSNLFQKSFFWHCS